MECSQAENSLLYIIIFPNKKSSFAELSIHTCFYKKNHNAEVISAMINHGLYENDLGFNNGNVNILLKQLQNYIH